MVNESEDGMLDPLLSSNTNYATLFTAAVSLALMVGWLVHKLIVAPRREHLFYRSQGLNGPPFVPLFGNLEEVRRAHEAAAREPCPIGERTYVEVILPHLWQWMKRYAPGEHGLVYGKATTTEVVLWDADLIKEFFTKAKCYKRDRTSKKLIQKFTGTDGLLVLDTGDFWAEQRKILNTGFRLHFLKGLHQHFMEASNELLHSWVQKVQSGIGSAEILISEDVKAATLNIISRATFGAGGIPLETATEALRALDERITMSLRDSNTLKFNIPGLGLLLRTEADRRADRENKFIDTLIEQIVDARIQATSTENDSPGESGQDLLGIMVEAMLGGSKTMTRSQIVGECRTMFVAGHSTTAQLVTWGLLLLAHHTDWQVKAREEVGRVTGQTGILEADGVNKLHIMGMIILEVLRLYPPAAWVSREARVRHKLGHLDILAGTNVLIAIGLLHLDEKYWDQPLVFEPERFEQGVGAACLNQANAFFPFGGGPRICIGQNFAVMEAKVLIACILQRFSLQVSPRYQHAPGPVSLTSAKDVLLLVEELDA